MRNEAGHMLFYPTLFVADRYTDLGNDARFKPPGFECLGGEFVEYRTAGALEHICVSHCSRRGINYHNANTISAEVAAFHVVGVLRQRRGDCH